MRITANKPREEAPPPKKQIEGSRRELAEEEKAILTVSRKEDIDSTFNGKTLEFPQTSKKLIAAIRSERIIQNREDPIISMRKLRSDYKIASDFIYKAVPYLIEEGIIERESVQFRGKIKSFSWRLLDHEFSKIQ